MPGTDFGILMMEVLTMLGPEIFTYLAIIINENGNLLHIVNSFFPPREIANATLFW